MTPSAGPLPPAPTGASPVDDDLARLVSRARTALPPPAPPPFPDVMARIDAEGARPRWLRIRERIAFARIPRGQAPRTSARPPGRGSVVPSSRRWVAVAATLLAVGGAFALGRRTPTGEVRSASSEEFSVTVPRNVRVLRAGQTLAAGGEGVRARAGDEVVADGSSQVRLGDRTAIELEPRARLRLGTEDGVAMLEGRATFDVRHGGARAFSVETDSVELIDRGTRFAVEVSAEAAGERVLVMVEQGEVAVRPTKQAEPRSFTLVAGQGLAFLAGTPTGAPFALSARPRLSLAAEDASPRSTRPVVVRLVFENPTDGWIALPAYDPVRAPLHVEVRAPDGSVQAVRVSEAMLVDGGGSGRSLPPRGTVVLRVRFEHTFASPGTYRLRAIYRPAGAVDEGASPDLVLPVR